jgi:DNA-binding NtrC family response regulator
MRGRILVVDDEVHTTELLTESLHLRGYAAEGVSSARACLERLSLAAADVVLTDVMMPEMSGIELCALLRDRYPDVLPIVLTGRYGTDVAVAAIRAGAYDYITKPVTLRALDIALGRALDHLALHHELDRLRTATAEDPVAGVVDKSSAIVRCLDLVRRVAPSDAAVLITGESGTGRERMARAIHHLSSRKTEPFVAINCGAMRSRFSRASCSVMLAARLPGQIDDTSGCSCKPAAGRSYGRGLGHAARDAGEVAPRPARANRAAGGLRPRAPVLGAGRYRDESTSRR